MSLRASNHSTPTVLDYCTAEPGPTAWMLFSTVLVLGMMPGLAMFEAGLLRAKNTVSIFTQVMAGLSFNSLLWYIVGFSLVFGDDLGGVIGSPASYPLFLNLSSTNCYEGTVIPQQAFAVFQMMFAAITPLLITGAFAERLLWKPFILFVVLWETFVYYPVAHWVWGGGWLGTLGTRDFAGGLVIHVTAGVASIVAARRLKHRVDFEETSGHYPPSNVPLACIGGSLLWMGWFGFNAGSTLGDMDLAATVTVNTQVASATAATVWLLIHAVKGPVSAIDVFNGAIVGLAAITPATGYITSRSAFVLGIVVPPVSFGTLHLIRNKLRIDDALDVSSVHGMPGVVGLIITGFCASSSVNSGIRDGIIEGGGFDLMWYQLAGIGVVAVYTAVVTRVIFFIIRHTYGRMVREHTERDGLDMADHAVVAYLHTDEDSEERKSPFSPRGRISLDVVRGNVNEPLLDSFHRASQA